MQYTYVELHCHSCFSFREGASTPLELVLQARWLGYPALALTDHDGLAGAMEFARTAKEWGVQPIIGAEVTLRPSPRPAATPLPRGEGTGVRAHLTLLAETARGYANLSRLLSMALLESPRGEPALDPAALAGRTDGLIALSGCREGEVSRRIGAGDVAGARTAAQYYAELFGREHFFIELQDNLVYGDRARNRGLVALARELRLDIVATNNVHYHERARHRLQDVLVAVQHRTSLDASERLRRKNAEFYLKSPEEMAALFSELPEALRHSVAIAERCVPHPEVEDGSEGDPQIAGEGTGVRGGCSPHPTHLQRNVSLPARPPQLRPPEGAPPPLHSPEVSFTNGTPSPLIDSPDISSDARGGAGSGAPCRESGACPRAKRRGVPQFSPNLPGRAGGQEEPSWPISKRRGFDLTRDLTYVFPDFEAPDGKTADEFLEEVCFAAARELYG